MLHPHALKFEWKLHPGSAAIEVEPRWEVVEKVWRVSLFGLVDCHTERPANVRGSGVALRGIWKSPSSQAEMHMLRTAVRPYTLE